jgi:malate dehydrogenase
MQLMLWWLRLCCRAVARCGRHAAGGASDVRRCVSVPHHQVTGLSGPANIDEALKDANIVVIPAGVPRKPGMSRDDLFNTNASIVKSLAEACAKNCPKAAFLIISNPVNSTVPIFAEVLKNAGVYDRRKLFGVTTLDVCRANKFVGDALGVDASKINVPVIGGHAGITILPLLSQVPGFNKLSQEDVAALTHRIQFGGDEVVKAKDGAGSATLSMAWAGAHFTRRVASALTGEKGVVECTFVETDKGPTRFFSTPVELGVRTSLPDSRGCCCCCCCLVLFLQTLSPSLRCPSVPPSLRPTVPPSLSLVASLALRVRHPSVLVLTSLALVVWDPSLLVVPRDLWLRCAPQVDGVENIRAPGAMSAFEKKGYDALIEELDSSIAKGVKFVRGK